MLLITVGLTVLSCSNGNHRQTKTANQEVSPPVYPCVLPADFHIQARNVESGPLTATDQDVLVAVWQQIVVGRQLYEESQTGTVDKVFLTLGNGSDRHLAPDSAFVARVSTDSTRVVKRLRDKWNGVRVELVLEGWAGPDTALVESSVLRGSMFARGMTITSVVARDSTGWRACREASAKSVK